MPPSAVSPAAPHELLPALRLLLGSWAERCRDTLAAGTQTPLRLFVTRAAGGRVCGAAMVQAMPGAVGVAWPPRADSPEAEDALAAAAADWLRLRGVKVCQAFVTAAELPLAAPLERAGFRRVTRLVFLRRELDPERDRQPPDALDGDYFRPDIRDDFAEAFLATHEGSRDGPELDRDRTRDELIAGAGLPGEASPWHFRAVAGGEAVGLWQAEPAGDVLTLAYLGVVPAARGRGMGGRLLRHLLARASGSFAAVELSADARNEPARRLYARHGFAETDRREVLIAHLAGEPGG